MVVVFARFVEGIEFCVTSGTCATMHGQGIRGEGGESQAPAGHGRAVRAPCVLRGRDSGRRARGA